MPRYDYQCQDCKEEFELDLKLSELEKSQLCPKCSSSNTTKLLSLGGGGILKQGQTKSRDLPPCASGGCCSGKCPHS